MTNTTETQRRDRLEADLEGINADIADRLAVGRDRSDLYPLRREILRELREQFPCQMCLGSGQVAVGVWGSRPPRKICPICDGARIQPRETTPDETVNVQRVEQAFALRQTVRYAVQSGHTDTAAEMLIAQIKAEDALNSTEFEMYEQKIREARS